jgi:hypothetical protein
MIATLDRITRILIIVLMLGFLAGLVWLYAYLPEQLHLRIRPGEPAVISLSKSAYFYGSLGLFAGLNGLLFLAYQMAGTIAPGIYANPFFRTVRGKSVFLLWLSSFQLAIGVMILLSSLYFGFMNVPDHTYGPKLPALAIGPLLVLLTFGLPFMTRRFPNFFDE